MTVGDLILIARQLRWAEKDTAKLPQDGEVGQLRMSILAELDCAMETLKGINLLAK